MKRQATGLLFATIALALPPIARADDSKQFTVAARFFVVKQLHKEKKYGPALKLLDELIGPISQRTPIPKPAQRGVGFTDLDVRKEKAMMLEEVAVLVPKIFPVGARFETYLWANAVQEWVAIIRAIAPSARDPLYFELYIEQKRCSLLAYASLGTRATNGDKAGLNAMFDRLSKDFQDVINKPGVPLKARDRALAIVRENKRILDDFERWNEERSKSIASPP